MTDNTNKSENINEVSAESEKTKRADESSPAYLFRLIITLTAICVAIAVLLAAVNAVTRDKIAENVMRSKAQAVLTIFEKGTDCELYKTLEDGSEVYLVYRDGGLMGYCAFVSSVGFGGNIDMMVGINADYETEGVKIVSMSETPGVGTKTDTPDFLDRFIGMSHSDPTGAVDAVSGATISSTAVKAGVVTAHAIELDLAAVCEEKGCVLLTPEMLEGITDESTEEPVSPDIDSGDGITPPETDAETTEPISPDTSADTTEPAETEDVPFVNNPGMRDFIYNVNASSGSDRFVIEIPKDDETATFETTKVPQTTTVQTNPPVVTTQTPVTTPESVPVTTEDEDTIPDWLDTQPEETIPDWLDTQPEETFPAWLDTQGEETAPSWIGG